MFFIPPHAYKLLGDLAKALVKINGFTRGGGGSHAVPDEVRGARWGQMRSAEVVRGELRGGEVGAGGPPSPPRALYEGRARQPKGGL